jgi:UPF0716 family protein affecting phage T7 exclusion
MIYLIPFFFIELYMSLSVGENIGFLWSVIWIIGSFSIGMGLIQNGAITMKKSMASLSAGKLNMKSFHDSATSYFLGALLLMLPGVFTDILGVISLLYTFYLQIGGTIPSSKNNKNINNINKQGDEDVIDVEIIESSSSHNLKR